MLAHPTRGVCRGVPALLLLLLLLGERVLPGRKPRVGLAPPGLGLAVAKAEPADGPVVRVAAALLLREELVHPVEHGQQHQRERAPRQRQELAAAHGRQPELAAEVRHLVDNHAAADGGDEVAYQEEEDRHAREAQVAHHDRAPGRVGDEGDGAEGPEERQDDEDGCDDVHCHDGLDDLRHVVKLVLDVICEAQVGYVQLQGADAELLVEQRSYVEHT